MLDLHIYMGVFLYVFSDDEPDYWNHQRFSHMLDTHSSEAFHPYVRVNEREGQSAASR